jgi:serine/threonine protein kinase
MIFPLFGGTLYDLGRHRTLSKEALRHIFDQCSSLITELHTEFGLIHGDIKPENIAFEGENPSIQTIKNKVNVMLQPYKASFMKFCLEKWDGDIFKACDDLVVQVLDDEDFNSENFKIYNSSNEEDYSDEDESGYEPDEDESEDTEDESEDESEGTEDESEDESEDTEDESEDESEGTEDESEDESEGTEDESEDESEGTEDESEDTEDESEDESEENDSLESFSSVTIEPMNQYSLTDDDIMSLKFRLIDFSHAHTPDDENLEEIPTRYYRCIETLEKKKAGFYKDWYALACTLYELEHGEIFADPRGSNKDKKQIQMIQENMHKLRDWL